MLEDVKTAFLHGDARRSSYVEWPAEDNLEASGRYVGMLGRVRTLEWSENGLSVRLEDTCVHCCVS